MLKQIARMTEQQTLDNSPPHPFTHSFQSKPQRMSLSTETYRRKHNHKIINGSNDDPVFSISATTLTRGNAPAYKIPKQKRFTDTTAEKSNKIRFLNLSLEGILDKGVSFAKSKRKDHFLSRQKAIQPSSASYFINDEANPQIQFSDINSELAEKLHIIATSNNQNRRYKINGPTIKKFEKTHKQFQHHGRQMIYQPQLTQNNPGVGSYQLESQNARRNSPSYSMRLVLHRFNQDKRNLPGPNAYVINNVDPHKSSSINFKGTFQQSRRIFLSKPCNMIPGPGSYFREK